MPMFTSDPEPARVFPMTSSPRDRLHAKLDALRAELSDLAFTLERRGRPDAADLATSVAARLGEICNEAKREGGGILSAVGERSAENFLSSPTRPHASVSFVDSPHESVHILPSHRDDHP